jgi:hypothetical protein
VVDSGGGHGKQEVRETLSSLGVANEQLLEDMSRAATAMEQDGIGLTEDDISEIADAVVERLLSRGLPQFSDADDSDRRRWREGLRTTAFDLGVSLAGSGVWTLLVYLAQHVHLLAPSDQDPAGLEREAQRRRVRDSLASTLSDEDRKDLESGAFLYRDVLFKGVRERSMARITSQATIRDYWAGFEAGGGGVDPVAFWAGVVYGELVESLIEATVGELN